MLKLKRTPPKKQYYYNSFSTYKNVLEPFQALNKGLYITSAAVFAVGGLGSWLKNDWNIVNNGGGDLPLADFVPKMPADTVSAQHNNNPFSLLLLKGPSAPIVSIP